MKFSIASVDSILITFCSEININCAKELYKLYTLLKKEPLIKEVVISYSSILIRFDILKSDFKEVKKRVLELYKETKELSFKKKSKVIKIPVYYSIEVGADLKRVAKLNSLSIEEVIAIHSNKSYYVYAIGFLPGFAYMGEVDRKIATPRLDSPRKEVIKGSVAIANTQTSIYPKNSAGGWNIIGRTPLELLSFNYDRYSLLEVGDMVEFIPITKKEFLKLGGKI
ncbi:MAG: 5-oxoprolinase subunit PxpB [Epsilonproteobacteria bacterium]|nr:5-oxoprolinase subunit PxpB [Campylobacterota bacterium]